MGLISKKKGNWIFVIFMVLYIISISLFASSFNNVGINEIGMKRDKHSKNIDSGKIYKSGRYFTGITGFFEIYSVTWKYIRFSNDGGSEASAIRTRTKDPSTIYLEATVVYRYKPELLHLLYDAYPSAEESQQKDMINQAQNIINSVTTSFGYEDFMTKREEINFMMSEKLAKAFRTKFFSEVELFLLRSIDLEDRFETTKLNELIKQQESRTEIIKQELTQIEAEIEVIESQIKSEVQIIENENELEIQTMQNAKLAEGKRLVELKEIEQMKKYQSDLKFDNEQLQRFFYYDQLNKMDSSFIYACFPESTVFQTSP